MGLDPHRRAVARHRTAGDMESAAAWSTVTDV